jgi:hypothetical protein
VLLNSDEVDPLISSTLDVSGELLPARAELIKEVSRTGVVTLQFSCALIACRVHAGRGKFVLCRFNLVNVG